MSRTDYRPLLPSCACLAKGANSLHPTFRLAEEFDSRHFILLRFKRDLLGMRCAYALAAAFTAYLRRALCVPLAALLRAAAAASRGLDLFYFHADSSAGGATALSEASLHAWTRRTRGRFPVEVAPLCCFLATNPVVAGIHHCTPAPFIRMLLCLRHRLLVVQNVARSPVLLWRILALILPHLW